METDREELLHIFRLMRLTRVVDERLRTLYLEGHIPGGAASARGYEATSVGAALALAAGDIIAPGEHDLGAMLARGLDLRAMLAQWLARARAPSRGRDGGVHWGDMREQLIVPPVDLPGMHLVLAAGAALGVKVRGERRVVLAFLSAPSLDLGSVHEALACAAALALPLVYVIEHVVRSHTSRQAADFVDRAAAYGISSVVVDGDDPLDVLAMTRAAIADARADRGPGLIEARLSRALPRPDAGEAEDGQRRDPVERFTRYLINSGALTPETIAGIEAEIAAQVDDAAIAALAASAPDPHAPVEMLAPQNALIAGPTRIRRALVRVEATEKPR
jgi:TPP-dependent pyruvate/acetoin dehydrogenase alpha subunit